MGKKVGMMGRPSKLTPELTTRLEALLSEWISIETACAMSGISAAVFHKWQARGLEELKRLQNGRLNAKPRASEVPYLEFVEAIQRGRAVATTAAVSTVRLCAKGYRDPNTGVDVPGDPKVAQWWLERTQTETYGRPYREAPVTDKREEVSAVVAALAAFIGSD
jgi:hypothetical protein